MNVEAGAHPKSRDQIVIRRGTSQSGAGDVSLADAFFVVERDGTELYIDRINEPSSGTGSGNLAAAVVLMAPSLAPEPGDIIYMMQYSPGAPAILAVDSGDAYDCPENWVIPQPPYVNSDLWVADPNQHVLIMFPDEPMPTAYALVRNTDFEQFEVLGGQVVSVGCGGAGFGTPALWVGNNSGAGLGGFIDPLAPATSFTPHLVTDAEVQISEYWEFSGTLSDEQTGISVDTAKKAFAVIDGFDLTGTLGVGLTAIDGLTPATDKLPYFTGSTTAALATFTAAGRALLDDALASDQRTTLGLGGAAILNVGTVPSTVAAGDDTRLVSFPLLVTGQYTSTSSITTAATTRDTNRLYYLPFLITVTTTFDRIAINHALTAAGAGSVVRLGIYNSTDGLPSTLVLDAGPNVDLSTAAGFKFIAISQTLTPGLYWLAAVPQITSGSPTFTVAPPSIAVPSDGSVSAGTKYQSSVTGALPATATPLAGNVSQPPVLYLRKSA